MIWVNYTKLNSPKLYMHIYIYVKIQCEVNKNTNSYKIQNSYAPSFSEKIITAHVADIL